ncbi:hypothetical protein [Mesorhizobium huakuii]|uniref:Uncharacterized protein n=1 Tax=Mesorhizobium huakuii TaxID=28104 RepID=A0A7G6SL51_9HYPH|nr:hypothetical protein [Mesorhizobium huakuii]QND55233.1 hypothetical protein HB778_14940 [Mesorhizobium huakuii]
MTVALPALSLFPERRTKWSDGSRYKRLIAAAPCFAGGTHAPAEHCLPGQPLEDVMTRAFDINENTEENPKRPPQPETGDDLRKKKVGGKAFQVNENSVDNPTPAPVTPKRD